MSIGIRTRFIISVAVLAACGSDPQPVPQDGDVGEDATSDSLDTSIVDSVDDRGDGDALDQQETSADLAGQSEVYQVIFEPDQPSFFSLPWPLDSRIDGDGHPDLSNFPGPPALTEPFLEAIETGVFGYGLSPVVFFQFDGLPPESSFPSSLASVEPTSPVQLVAIEEGRCSAPIPIEMRAWIEDDGYVPANTVAISPVPGVVLKPETTYAVVVRTVFGAPFGEAVLPSALQSVLDGGSDYPELETAYGPLADCIGAGDVVLGELAAATVFTTGDPRDELALMSEVAADNAGQLDELVWTYEWRAGPAGTESFSSQLQMPVFQTGEMPYTEDGGIVLDEHGLPVVQRWDEVPIYIAWPSDASGPIPLVVWLPGTGGDWETTLDYPPVEWLLRSGVAIAGFDSQFHGARNPTDADAGLATFNYTNPTAGRNVLRQQALELLYFLAALDGAELDIENGPVLDASTISVGGHSQGALAAGLAAGVDDDERAYLLAATGGHVALSALGRTQPFDVRELLEVTFDTELDRFHPLMAALQLGSEVVDPLAYTAWWGGWDDTPGRHVFVLNGDEDEYVPKETVDALTIATGFPQIAPAGWEIESGVVRTIPEVETPATNTVAGDDGADLTSAMLHVGGEDHFLIYEHGRGLALATSFLLSASSGETTPKIGELCQASSLNEHEEVEGVSWYIEDEFSEVAVRLRENELCRDSGSTSRSYQFTAPRSGTYRIRSDVDDFAVSQSCLPFAEPVGCADGSSLDVTMEADETVFIDFASGHGTDLALAVGLTGVAEGNACGAYAEQCEDGLICLFGTCRSPCAARVLNDYPTGDSQWGERGTFPGMNGLDSGIWPLPETCRESTVQTSEIPYVFTPPETGVYRFSTDWEASEASAYLEIRDGCDEEGETLACAGFNSPMPSTVEVELTEAVPVMVVLHATNTFSHGQVVALQAGLVHYGTADDRCDNLLNQCEEGLVCADEACRSACQSYVLNDFEVADGEWAFEGAVPGLSRHYASTIAWPEACEYSNVDQSGDVTFAFTAPASGLYVFRGGFEDRTQIDITVADSCDVAGDFLQCAEDNSSSRRAPVLELELTAEQANTILVSAIADTQNGRTYRLELAEVRSAELNEACDGEVTRCSEGHVCIEGTCRDSCEAFVLSDSPSDDGSFSHATVFPGFRGEDAGTLATPAACDNGEPTAEITYLFTAPSTGKWVFAADDIETTSRPILWRMTSCDSDPAEAACFEEGEVPTMALVLDEGETATVVVEPSSQLRHGKPVLVTATRAE